MQQQLHQLKVCRPRSKKHIKRWSSFNSNLNTTGDNCQFRFVHCPTLATRFYRTYERCVVCASSVCLCGFYDFCLITSNASSCGALEPRTLLKCVSKQQKKRKRSSTRRKEWRAQSNCQLVLRIHDTQQQQLQKYLKGVSVCGLHPFQTRGEVDRNLLTRNS